MNDTATYALQDYYKGLITAGEALDVLLTEIEGTLLHKCIIAADGEQLTDAEAIHNIKEYLQCQQLITI